MLADYAIVLLAGFTTTLPLYAGCVFSLLGMSRGIQNTNGKFSMLTWRKTPGQPSSRRRRIFFGQDTVKRVKKPCLLWIYNFMHNRSKYLL
jgi:hypothetical protein